MVHRYALAAKTLPQDSSSVISDGVAMLNYIKTLALYT